MAGLKHRIAVADVSRGAMPMPPYQAGGEIGEDVAEHVLHHHDIEIPGRLTSIAEQASTYRRSGFTSG